MSTQPQIDPQTLQRNLAIVLGSQPAQIHPPISQPQIAAPGPITIPQKQPDLSISPSQPTPQPFVMGPNGKTSGQVPRGTLQGDQEERERLLNSGSGVSQISKRIQDTQFGQNHPLLSKILGGIAQTGATIGDVGLAVGGGGMGRLAEEMIPGTMGHHQILEHQANTAVNQDEANAATEAQTQENQARTGEDQARENAIENPQPKPEKEETWKPLLGGNGEVLQTAPGKLIEVSSEGNLRQNDLPAATTVGLKPTTANSAFAQWAANPGKYEDFQKTMAEIKAQVAAEHPHQAANSSFMNIYAAQRFLQMAYTNNPGILPVASQMIGKLLNLSPEQTAQLGGVPEGQPRDEAGNPIGLHQPGAPTVGSRNRGQFFESIDPSIGDVQQQIASIGDQLGPAQGRWMEVYEGKGGFNAPEYAGLRADLHNIATAWSRLHVNSAQARQDFLHTLTTAQTPQDLLAGLRSIQKQGRDYELEGQGRPDRLGKEPGSTSKGTFDSEKWAKANPKGDVAAAKAYAKSQGYEVK